MAGEKALCICDLCDLRQNADKYRSKLGEVCGFFSEGVDTFPYRKLNLTSS
jgi:hypothetical protein